jgi:hypothetical protein
MARSALAQATSFAHLMGLGRGAPAAGRVRAADDDERKQKDGESDADYKDRMDKLDDKEEKAAKAAAAAQPGRVRAAEDDDERKQRDGESDADYKDRMDKLDDKEARQARRAEDDDEMDDGDAKASAARGRERARCAAIFAEPAAAKRPDIAAHLAFGTNLPRTAAINTLRAVAAGEPSPPPEQPQSEQGLRSRMVREPVYDVGSEAERTRAGAETPAARAAVFAAKVMAADKKRLGGA